MYHNPGLKPAEGSIDAELPQRWVDALFGSSDASGRRIEEAVRPYRLRITPLPGAVRLEGDQLAVTLAEKMIKSIDADLQATGRADAALIRDSATAVIKNALKHDLSFRIVGLRSALCPMSLSQLAFMNAMLFTHQSLIFGIGPTGTGKTHLAIAAGLSLVTEAHFKRLIITRPHVRADGEVMTPELRAEIADDAQLTPIEDELHALVGREETQRLIAQGLLEIMPLGRMRGRTFNGSFIVVDEAQHMSVRNMRMVVTRLGRGTRMVVTGDPAQSELPSGETSGLTHLLGMIAGTDLALVHKFENQEIIRNDLVARIETLYSRDDGMNILAAA